MIVSAGASLVAIQGVADSGVTSGNPGEQVNAVTTTGYAWPHGIRPGQVVDVLIPSGQSGGWSIETHDASGAYSAAAATPDQSLRDSLPIAIGALVLAYLSLVFLRTRRRWVLPAGALAILAASLPLQLEGSPEPSTVGMGLAAIVPIAAYAFRLERWRWLEGVALGSLVALAGGWAVLRLTGDPASAQAEAVRSVVAPWATVALVVERLVVPAMTGQQLSIIRPRLFDVVVAAALIGSAILISVFFSWPMALTGALVVLVLAMMPAARRRLARPIEEILFGDVRQQAAAEASEAERARLARDLHDVPLQELAAVIRRLEILPGAEAESEDLRALAGHLRNVATELRPPVLDDLGLPAALDFLAEQSTSERLPVTAEIVDDTGFGPDRRPPTDVELAVFRIAAEAVGNAVRHSGGRSVEVRGAVAPDRVELSVTDDGAGLTSETAREATRRKRLGLASMRRRAEAIDAELAIESSPTGTVVNIAWRA